MKKIFLFVLLALFFASCGREGQECMSPPPMFSIIIVNNKIPDNKYDISEISKKEAVLYKLSDNDKIKIEDLYVDNDNIFISSQFEKVKTFFTSNLETFYVEYKGKTDTLQIKGIYHDSTGCGDRASLSELYFNGKEVDIKNNLIDDGVYKIENTTPK